MQKEVSNDFRRKVEELVAQIPYGSVMSYGEIAATCGSPLASRVVGGVAHYGDPNLPWHRVVSKSGGLATGYPGGRSAQAAHLRAEGVDIKAEKVNMAATRWRPESALQSNQTPAPLVVLLGETASGKSDLAIEIAERFGGEIICADSCTVYKGLDIGTAKPTAEQRTRVRHHLLDVVSPDQTFSAAEFQKLARQAIEDITSRGKIPIIVGGTGLFIDSVIFDLHFRRHVDRDLRSRLEQLSLDDLQHLIIKSGYDMPENLRNKRYLIRTIETSGETSSRGELRPHTLVIGLKNSRESIEDRIASRVEMMIRAGFIEECAKLLSKYGRSASAMNSSGYKEIAKYISGELTIEYARRAVLSSHLRLAKKQRTWFRRKIYQNVIQWVDNRLEAVALVTTFLNK